MACRAGISEMTCALQKIQMIIIAPMFYIIFADQIKRSYEFHSFVIAAPKFRHHSLDLTAMKHSHKYCFYNIVIVMTKCYLVAAKPLCFFIKISSSHSCTEVAGIFLNAINSIKDFGLK